MKTKLLKKIRKQYRVIRYDNYYSLEHNGEEIGFYNYDACIRSCSYKTRQDAIDRILNYYKNTNKKQYRKSNSFKRSIVWYNG